MGWHELTRRQWKRIIARCNSASETGPMPATVESLGIDRLSRDEQLALVHAIWDRIAASATGSFLTDAQRDDLRQRVAADDARPDDLIPWEQVKAESPLRKQA